MKRISIIAAAVLFLSIAGFLLQNLVAAETETASGRIVGGYRVLTIPEGRRDVRLTVYRGDYLRFEYAGAADRPVLSIPALAINETLARNSANTPYFKMQKTGTFAFSFGDAGGTVTVVEYRKPEYEAIQAARAAELIRNIHPVILDVRTPPEYRAGHIEGAILIPVQELQGRLAELSKFKDENILVYCATGNRSTVASKILIDHGFKRIFNLRHGIYEWKSENYPVVQ